MTESIDTLEKFENILNTHPAVLVYFKTTSCSVVEALEPKVKSLIENKFQKLHYLTIDINLAPKIISAYQAFVEPTILVFFEGKETIRRSRNISVIELEKTLLRSYELFFQ